MHSNRRVELNGVKVKSRKEENMVHDIIVEDRESISKHARIIADLLETVELNSY